MNVVEALAQSPLFEALEPSILQALAARVTPLRLRGGATLLDIGEPPDAMYIVVSGRLRALSADGSLLGDIGRGEPVGEIGLLADEPRAARVVAVRDSVLLRLVRGDLVELYGQHPLALLETVRVVIRRLRRTQGEQRRDRARGQRALAVVPALPGVDVSGAARGLVEALSRHGPVRLLDAPAVDAALGPGSAEALFDDEGPNERVMAWLAEQERSHRYLVYLAHDRPGAWARRCMRQSDRILLAVPPDAAPATTPMVEELLSCGTLAQTELLVLGAPSVDGRAVLDWRARVRARQHRYLPPGLPGRIDSLARCLTERGLGLVLGGGGARGFAHLGLVRALEELALPVDVIGGSSMGAFYGALKASGFTLDEMLEITRSTFVERNHLNDYLFPSVALIRGRKFVRRLHQIFGERRIECLPTPFFCLSSNLSRGRIEVHEEGLVHLWVATSMAVPGVAPPVVWNEDLLVDGALMNSLPVDVMARRGQGPVLASDVSTGGVLRAPGILGPDPEGLFNWKAETRRPGLIDILFRSATAGNELESRARAARADVYLRMPVSDVGMFDWKRFDEIYERGYVHAMEQLSPLRDALAAGQL